MERFALTNQGVGNAGCPLHPQPVCKGSKHTVVTTVAPGSPGIPARNGFNGFLRALLGDRLVVTVACGYFRTLDASAGASGPHDFAVRFSAIRQKRIRVHRIPRQRS